MRKIKCTNLVIIDFFFLILIYSTLFRHHIPESVLPSSYITYENTFEILKKQSFPSSAFLTMLILSKITLHDAPRKYFLKSFQETQVDMLTNGIQVRFILHQQRLPLCASFIFCFLSK